MLKYRFHITLVLSLVWLSTISFSRDISFRKFNMNTGLSHNSVLCMAQDRSQLMWIGTRDGLNRFNGIDYTIFKHNFNDSNSISNNQVNSICETANGDLWFGTAYGLSHYKYAVDCFENFLPAPDSSGITHEFVRTVIETPEKEILVGTSSGLNLLKPGGKSIQRIYLDKNPLANTNNIICLFKDSKNRIWAGTRNGLFLRAGSGFKRVYLNKPHELMSGIFEIRDLADDSKGNLWIATEESGLYIIKPDEPFEIIKHYQKGFENFQFDHIRTICLNEKDNEAWLGTMDGLVIMDLKNSRFSLFQYSSADADGLSNNSVRDILQDHLGGFWIATYSGGVNYYHPWNNSFLHFRKETDSDNTLSSNIITGFLEDENGNLWITTEGGGLNFWKQKENSYIWYKHDERNKNSLPHDNVKSITRDSRGNLWIGTFSGLSRFNAVTGKFTSFFSDEDDGNTLINNQVHAVFADRDDQIWIGTNGGGLQIYLPGKNEFTKVTGIKNRNINVILEDKKNKIWIGCQDGLACIDRITKEPVDLESRFPEITASIQYVQSIFLDHAERIWVGTQGYGLFLFDEKQVLWFNKDNGLPDNTIVSILEDDHGQIWMATNKGLSKITISGQTQTGPKILVRTFSLSQGLQSLQYYPMSALKSKTGMFYFGGINGFNAFSPELVEYAEFSPEIVLTGIKIRNQSSKAGKSDIFPFSPVNETKTLTLQYNQRDVNISFVGINYMDPEGTFYRYRLVNHGNEWIDIGYQREINFTYLPVGSFELQIQASTSPDTWENRSRAVKLTVLPPWYMTGYAFLFYFLLVGFLLFVFFSYSQKWAQLKHELMMEHFQREKEEELHQMKLRFFTDISHELRTPLTLIMAPLEKITQQPDLSNRLRNQLLSIHRNGYRMIQLINKVLDLRKIETGHGKLSVVEENISVFLEETCLAFSETARIKNIRLEFQTTWVNLKMWFDREKMEIILYNLLSNALKNTNPGGAVVVRLEFAKAAQVPGIGAKIKGGEDVAIISVEDNGEGIVKEKLDSIFKRFYSTGVSRNMMEAGSGVGLELTKRLVELHRGLITVESRKKTAENPGFTVFSLFIPASPESYDKSEIAHNSPDSEDISQYVAQSSPSDFSGEEARHGISLLPGMDTIRSKKNVLLIVEDNAELRKFLCDLFGTRFIVEEAGNGQEGWEIALKYLPDLIISDIMMPEINGIELCRRIKTDIRTSHIPVILLTARTAITFRYEGLETGADDYITKPFSAEYLAIRVKNLIRQRELMRNHFIKEAICDPAKITVTSIDEKLLKKTVDFITNNISDKSISVEKLSREVGLSRVHFYRKIKALTNLSAVEFIRSIRLKRAASILEQKKLSVKEVADLVGFDDTDYFRISFKKQFGINPSEYPENQSLN